MIVHLIDGTYELFRHFYGLRRFRKDDPPLGAVLGVVRTVVQMFESDATHLGVATDHVIESFRNELWPGYKTGDGIEPALLAQFHPLEEALVAMGVAVWPMVELEADDALASAAHLAAGDARVEKVCIWTPDKDLAQSVRGDRVVQVDRRGNRIRNEAGVVDKFGVVPELIPDYLALVGDAADGYPGIPGIGAATAARLLNRHGGIENLPDGALGGTHGRASGGTSGYSRPGASGDTTGEPRELAMLFRELATLRTDAPLFDDVDSLDWRGPTGAFDAWAARLGDDRLLERVRRVAATHGAPL
jgi:5'-3' exonuclease